MSLLQTCLCLLVSLATLLSPLPLRNIIYPFTLLRIHNPSEKSAETSFVSADSQPPPAASILRNLPWIPCTADTFRVVLTEISKF
jgi:hypothetical protein